MTLRVAKVVLIFAVALFYTFVLINNLTDYNSNYQFVRHVLMMDSTLPGNHGMWRVEFSALAHRILCLRHRVGIDSDDALLVGRVSTHSNDLGTGKRFQPSEADSRGGTNSGPAYVAGRVFGRRRRVVFDVAVKNLEWPGRRVPDVHGSWHCAAFVVSTGV